MSRLGGALEAAIAAEDAARLRALLGPPALEAVDALEAWARFDAAVAVADLLVSMLGDGAHCPSCLGERATKGRCRRCVATP